MKKLVIAIVLAVLIAALPASTVLAAAPARTLTVNLDVMAIGRDLVQDEANPGHLTGTVTYIGKVTDATKDSRDWKQIEGSKVWAQENVDYWIYADGTVAMGNVSGKLIILDTKLSRDWKTDAAANEALGKLIYGMDGNGKLFNKDSKTEAKSRVISLLPRLGLGAVVINYTAVVTGNIFTGPASDDGSWNVVKTTPAYKTIAKASGDWAATVSMVQIGDLQTFAGTATVSGTY